MLYPSADRLIILPIASNEPSAVVVRDHGESAWRRPRSVLHVRVMGEYLDAKHAGAIHPAGEHAKEVVRLSERGLVFDNFEQS